MAEVTHGNPRYVVIVGFDPSKQSFEDEEKGDKKYHVARVSGSGKCLGYFKPKNK